MPKILMPIGDATEALDTFYAYYRLPEDGFDVVVAGPAARRQAQRARRDERAVAAFARDVQVPIEEIRRIPLEAQDPHSLEALAGLGRKLFGCTDPGRPAEAPCE